MPIAWAKRPLAPWITAFIAQYVDTGIATRSLINTAPKEDIPASIQAQQKAAKQILADPRVKFLIDKARHSQSVEVTEFNKWTKDRATAQLEQAIENAKVAGNHHAVLKGIDQLVKLHGLDSDVKSDVQKYQSVVVNIFNQSLKVENVQAVQPEHRLLDIQSDGQAGEVIDMDMLTAKPEDDVSGM